MHTHENVLVLKSTNKVRLEIHQKRTYNLEFLITQLFSIIKHL
jgi:hypothetical protein